MAILFLLDGLLYQAALWLAPLLTDLGIVATPGLHLQLGLCWLLAFLVLDVYNPSKGIRWSQEGQRVFMASVLAGLLLAGLLYLSGGVLPRGVFIVQIGIAAVLIWGYRIVLGGCGTAGGGCGRSERTVSTGSWSLVQETSASTSPGSSSTPPGPAWSWPGSWTTSRFGIQQLRNRCQGPKFWVTLTM